MRRSLCLAIPAVFWACAALAQTATDEPPDEAAETPAAAGWNDTIRSVFFRDEASMTLRPEDDIRARWAELSPEDQDRVQKDCAATRSGSVGGADPAQAEAEAEAGETASPPPSEPPPMASEATGPAGSAVSAGDISLSHLVQICALVDEVGGGDP